jgi:hypothetical protein
MKTLSIVVTLMLATTGMFAQEDCCKPDAKASAKKAMNSTPQEIQALASIQAKDVTFYRVPLVCPAAPEIGCGGKAKPILKQLEEREGVSHAWLNREGTLLAVVWESNTSGKAREQAVIATCDREMLTFTELKGKDFQRAFESFTSGNGWYRAASLDQLSEREAEVIVARLVQRTKAKVSLSDEKTHQLQSTLLTYCREELIANTKKDRKSFEDELLQAVRNFLSEEETAALREAVTLGFRPLPNEK